MTVANAYLQGRNDSRSKKVADMCEGKVRWGDHMVLRQCSQRFPDEQNWRHVAFHADIFWCKE
jgi:nucleoid-associated protein YejK